MEKELILENLVEKMLNELFNSGLLDEEDDDEEKKCIEEIINILEERISYY
jgi:hypothetical protein